MDDQTRQRCGRRGVGNVLGTAPLPAEPTFIAPGSPERLAVMAERARRGEQLRHPDDATFAQADTATAPRKLTERLGRTYAASGVPLGTPDVDLNDPAAKLKLAPALCDAPPPAPPALNQPATSAREVPGLLLHRGTQVWRASFKVRCRRVTVYFGREWGAASERYRRWAATWPAPLLAEVPPIRDRARLIDTPDGPVRLHDAAKAAGIRPGTLAYRLDVLRWPVADALTPPARGAERQERFRIHHTRETRT